MSSHISMTHNEDSIPVLLVSTEAPLDALHASAASRFLAVTQMMESLASLDIKSAKGGRCTTTGSRSSNVVARRVRRDGCSRSTDSEADLIQELFSTTRL
ncbi:short-chain dehydrogenase [Pseudomonas helmanticensis]|jgi:hypothetical protein|uniref:short-chain dehydrogenase n=1 Tax=Pseudomonas helmanticensis TaxID=1471381 RepID=UPI0037FDEE51